MEPSFHDLLAQLQEAHERQLQELKAENTALRAQAVEQQPKSEWRVGLQGAPAISAADLKTSFDAAHSAQSEPQMAESEVLGVGDESVPGSKSGPTGKIDRNVDDDPDLAVRITGTTTSGVGKRKSRYSNMSMVPRKMPGSMSVFESVVPTSISFQALCKATYPDKEWRDLICSERVELLRKALRPKHRLISPHSRMMKRWDILISLALFFVGLVTPYEVVFLDDVEWGLFAVNRVVDLIFILDIVLQFFLIVEIYQPHRGGSIMVRDPAFLRRRYLRSWFFIDMVSIFPFDVVSILVASPTSVLQRAKIVRCLKMLRIIKLLRILRSSKILERWKNSIALPFATQKLIKFLVVLAFISHWMACVWGFCGLTLGASLSCDGEGQIVQTSVSLTKTSWVTTLYLGGKTSPDTPCNHFAVYTASLHWAVMTLTSIGYGDIVPVRLEEYIVGIACMLAGGVLWAYVIGSLCSIISNGSPVEREFETNTDLLNLAMDEARVPTEERPKYREYLREAKAYDRRVSFGQVAEGFSPMLRKELMYFVTKDVLEPTYYFKDAPREFLMDIASVLKARFFSRREPLDDLRHTLCMLDRGTVAHSRRVLVPPSVFNEDFIIAKKYQKYAVTFSLTYTQVLSLERYRMDALLECYPQFSRKIRRFAAKLAFCRVLQMAKVLKLPWEKKKGSSLTLGEAFDKVCADDRLKFHRILS